MTLRKFLAIYKRNVLGVVRLFPDPGIFKHLIIVAGPIYLASLPFTTTLGAGLKSLIDYKTRKNFSDEEIGEFNSKIDELNPDDLDKLIKNITDYKTAKSTSSESLIQKLKSNVPHAEQTAVNQGYVTKKKQLQIKQLSENDTINPITKYTEEYIESLALDAEYQKLLDDYDTENKETCQSQKITNQKALIKGYVGSLHNNGKKIQCIVDCFFSPKKQVQTDPATSQPKDNIQITPLS